MDMATLIANAKAAMCHFRYSYLTCHDDLVADVVTAMCRADADWRAGHKCKKSSLKMTYARNCVRNWLRNKTLKYIAFNDKMTTIDKGSCGQNNRKIYLRDTIQQPTKDLNYDQEKLHKLVDSIDIAPRKLEIFKEFYLLGYTCPEIGEKRGITKSRVQQITQEVLKKLKKVAKKEELYVNYIS